MADPAPTADAPTPNYGFNLPTVGGDDNVWGGLLNDNWSNLDTILWTVSGVASAALTQTAGDARYLRLSGGTIGPNSTIFNGPVQNNNYTGFASTAAFSGQAQFTGGATFGTAQVFFNSQVTFSADALMVTPAASDNSSRAATTAWVNSAITASVGSYLPLAGGAMTGPLTLAADPSANLGAATKQYVDAAAAAASRNVAGGFVNKFRNGTFDVWQRGNVNTPVTGSYTVDGWMINWAGAAPATVSRGGQTRRSASSMIVNGAAGNTQVALTQRVESYLSSQLTIYQGGTQPVTVQFAITNNTASSFTPQLSVNAANAMDTWPASTPVLAATNLQPCPPGALTVVAYTFGLTQAQAVNGIAVILNFPAGLASATTIFLSDADLRATPGVPLGLNANPPPPELRPIATELAFCQRYFSDSSGNGGSTPTLRCVGYAAGAGAIALSTFNLPVVMRAVPTVVVRNQAYTNASLIAVSGLSTVALAPVITASAVGNTRADLNLTASAEL